MQELVIDTIDHYRVQQLLARGGMAEVYLAQDMQTGKQVAMKPSVQRGRLRSSSPAIL